MKKKILIANLVIRLGTNLICLGITMQKATKTDVDPLAEQHSLATDQLEIIRKGS